MSVRISYCAIVSHRDKVVALIHLDGKLQAQATGATKLEAIREAVRMFRLARYDRRVNRRDRVNALCRAVTCAVDEIKATREAGLLDESNWLLIVEACAADAGVSESELAATLTSGGFPCPTN